MDPVPHHSYVIPQQRPIGDSSNKRKDAYFGDASDSYDRKVSESEGKNQESAARRDTDNHSGNIILIGESMLGHAAGRMSNHNFPSAQGENVCPGFGVHRFTVLNNHMLSPPIYNLAPPM